MPRGHHYSWRATFEKVDETTAWFVRTTCRETKFNSNCKKMIKKNKKIKKIQKIKSIFDFFLRILIYVIKNRRKKGDANVNSKRNN